MQKVELSFNPELALISLSVVVFVLVLGQAQNEDVLHAFFSN